MSAIESKKKISVIIAAGGNASRFGQKDLTSKQFLLLSDKPLLSYSIEKFVKIKNVFEIIVVTNNIEQTNGLINKFDFKFKVVEGGDLRQDSVYKGFCEVDKSSDLVVIHDVARPLFKIENLNKCIERAVITGVSVLASPVVDTIKSSISDKDRLLVKETVDRAGLFLIQTPQVFSYNLLDELYKKFRTSEYSKRIVTDEANMAEILGEEVELIPGDRTNIKITYQEDLILAEGILKEFNDLKSKNTRLESGVV